jgi:hypothetical protein
MVLEMTEQDRVTCPFCGKFLVQAEAGKNAFGHIHETCPISDMYFFKEQWAMRPPKKEAPQGKAILSEVEWLRQMVAVLTIAPEPKHYAVTYPSYPGNLSQPETFYATREGTAK